MDAGKVIGYAALGVGGFLAWTELIDPYLKQRALEAQARALAAKTGMNYKAALAQVGAAACKAYLTSTGSPPNPLSNAACGLAGQVASIVVMKGGKEAIKGLKLGARAVAHNPVTAAGVILAAPVVVPYLVAEKIPGVNTAVNTAKKAVSKLKFWGLEGLSC